ncbi:MAG TPA: hypothetical protein VEJ84_01825, partial [Acidimicrobiales bacterium]|nr:hypothetical protein [Acidimicrobiales bacterium]
MRNPSACSLALLGVFAAAIAGCATSSGAALGAKRSPVYSTYETTVDTRTARVSVDLEVNALRSQSYVLAQGEVELSNSSCALTVLEMGTTVHELLAGGDLYVELPALARATNSGKPWAEVVLRSGHEVGPGIVPTSALTEVDPLPLLDLLQLRPKSSVLVGKDNVSDQASTEYRLMYAEAELSHPVPAGATVDQGAGVVGLLAQLARPVPKIFPIDIWLDSEGRLIQLAASATLGEEPPSPSPAQAALANSLPTTVSVQLDLGDFGAPVKLDVPAAAEVARWPLSRL